MENWKIEDICVDALWNTIYSISSFYNKKVNLMAYIYGEIIDKIDKPRSMKISAMAKKKLFENNLVKYFSAVRDAAVKSIKASDRPSEIDIDGDVLTERGFARLSILSNIGSNIQFSPKTNKNIFLALGNALSDFSLKGTQFEGKGLFEIMYNYFNKHDNLYTSNAKSASTSFIANIENEPVIDGFLTSFQNYLKKQMRVFQKDMLHQEADEFSVKIIDDVLAEVDKEYNMHTANFSSVISLNLPRRILLLHGIDTDSNNGPRTRRNS